MPSRSLQGWTFLVKILCLSRAFSVCCSRVQCSTVVLALTLTLVCAGSRTKHPNWETYLENITPHGCAHSYEYQTSNINFTTIKTLDPKAPHDSFPERRSRPVLRQLWLLKKSSGWHPELRDNTVSSIAAVAGRKPWTESMSITVVCRGTFTLAQFVPLTYFFRTSSLAAHGRKNGRD